MFILGLKHIILKIDIHALNRRNYWYISQLYVRNILTVKNIDEFDKNLSICQYFFINFLRNPGATILMLALHIK